MKIPAVATGVVISLTIACLAVAAQTAPAQSRADRDLEVWQQFVADLKGGKLTADNLRPYQEGLRAPLFGFLSTMRQKADWKEWQAAPEIYRVQDQLHFLIPLTFDGGQTTYCFSFVRQAGKWFFQHLESIFIRLDRTGAPPVSTFPDVAEEHKAWMREEMHVNEQVSIFNLLAKEKGKPFAFDWFRDGVGYFLAARAWVPFVPPSRAFILYACWEQANLRGNRVTLEELSDTHARIRAVPNYLQLYENSGHLHQQIAFEDYRQIFETIWQDRAKNAGWNLNLTCTGAECVFDFRRATTAQGF